MHDNLLDCLRKIKDDRTFNQSYELDRLSGEMFYSYDLSAATDRFPFGFQKAVIEELYGENIAEA